MIIAAVLAVLQQPSSMMMMIHAFQPGGIPLFQPLRTTSIQRSSSSSSTTTTTQLQYTNTPSSSSFSDHERYRQAIAAAAATRSLYYKNELSIQELDQVRASFELLLQKNHLYYSSSSSSTALEVYYPEGVIHPTTVTHTSEQKKHITETYIEEESQHHHLLLTTAGRRLRELEIQLLESIRTNDDGIDQLVHLWTTERNTDASHALMKLQNTNSICSHGLVQEEQDLATLCSQYPGWAEPWSRLATLLFYKGIVRWSDALSAAEEAIRIKPWHFEALNVCTLILLQMNHPDNPDVIFGDDDSVADLRRRCYRLSRLALPKLKETSSSTVPPPPGSSSSVDHEQPYAYSSYSNTPSKEAFEARDMWVSRAVATAQYQLQCAEEYTAAFRSGRCHPPPQQQQEEQQYSNGVEQDDVTALSAWQ